MTAALLLFYVGCAFWKLSEQGGFIFFKGVSYILVHQLLSLYSVEPLLLFPNLISGNYRW